MTRQRLNLSDGAWYRAAVERSGAMPVLLSDIANRIRAARRFLNYVADHLLYDVQARWALTP